VKQIVYSIILLLVILCNRASAQKAAIFPKDEKSTNVHNTGTVWLHELNVPDSVFNYSIAQAVFEPGAKLDWHIHPAGQILLISQGAGYYQERGKPKQTVHKGDIIKCLPGVEHWHGAAPKSSFAYIATTPAHKGKTIWLKRVIEKEYQGLN